MISSRHALVREEVIHRARELVKSDRVQFTRAGQQLDDLYTEEIVRLDDPDPLEPGEKYALQENSEQILFMRLDAAIHCLLFPSQHRYDNHLDFLSNASEEDRRMSARMAVLVLLAAIDANKFEVIDESMGKIASIPFEICEFKDNKEQQRFGGSAWIDWSVRGWDYPNEPSPDVIRLLKEAVDVAEYGSIKAARKSRIPSGDGRPCDLDGRNKYDECERSLRDLARYVDHFHYCETHYREEWSFRDEVDTRKELLDIKIENRKWWAKWPDVVNRVRKSITSIHLPELNHAKQRAFEALCDIVDVYKDPVLYLEYEQAGDHLFRRAQAKGKESTDAKRLQILSKALDDLEPLRKGCGLYLDEVEDVVREDHAPGANQQSLIQVVIGQGPTEQQTETPREQSRADIATKSTPKSVDAVTKKALAICKRNGWPIVRGKASIRAMAERVKCSPSTMRKALNRDASLRRYHTKAEVPNRSHLARESDELTELIQEQAKDARRDRLR